MAYDKVVDSTVLDNGLTAIAGAVRTKGGTSAALSFPTGIVNAINAIPSGLDYSAGQGTYVASAMGSDVFNVYIDPPSGVNVNKIVAIYFTGSITTNHLDNSVNTITEAVFTPPVPFYAGGRPATYNKYIVTGTAGGGGVTSFNSTTVGNYNARPKCSAEIAYYSGANRIKLNFTGVTNPYSSGRKGAVTSATYTSGTFTVLYTT